MSVPRRRFHLLSRIRPGKVVSSSVRVLGKPKRDGLAHVMTDETRDTFEAISDASNAHLFTTKAALAAFKLVKV